MHDDVIRRDYDAERQAYLESHDIRVLYFENRALLELSDYVVGVAPLLAKRGDGAAASFCNSFTAS